MKDFITNYLLFSPYILMDKAVNSGKSRSAERLAKVGRFKVAHRFVEVFSLYQLKHCLARAVRKIKHSALSLDANITLGFALCYISHLSLVASCFILHIALAAML